MQGITSVFTEKVNGKLNLGLHIVGRRADAFHDIETVFYPTDFYTDSIVIGPSSRELEFVCAGDAVACGVDDNLCVKAFRLLQRDYGIGGVKISLEKGIPSGAGLGGGSADAAFTLKMLAKAFALPVNARQMAGYALRLGSDVPFFIHNRPMYATGRGEILRPAGVDLSAYRIIITKPDFSVSTKEAYAGVTPHAGRPRLTELTSRPVEEWKDTVKNDFETTLFAKYPELQRIKEDFYRQGAVYASMSGSGTAIFGIFGRQDCR